MVGRGLHAVRRGRDGAGGLGHLVQCAAAGDIRAGAGNDAVDAGVGSDRVDGGSGDDVIDVLGFDDYHSIRTAASRDTFAMRLRTVSELAVERGKLSALTETGVETVPDPTWWTGVLLPAIETDAMTRRISYALVWRNANPDGDRADHFYAPHPGHPSVPDFVRFYESPTVLFEDELPDLYTLPVAR